MGSARPIWLYALASSAVIVAGDLLLHYAARVPFTLAVAGAAKGFVFIGVTSVLLDRLRRRRDVERERRAADERLLGVTETIAGGVLTVGDDGRITYANPAAATILGVAREELVGLRHDDERLGLVAADGTRLARDAYPAEVARRTGKPVTGAVHGLERADGTWVVLSTNAARLPGDAGIVVSLTDLTQQVATNDRIEQLLYYDHITGLPSRALMEKYVDFAVTHARRHDRAIALLHLDIDGFKLVNDSLGKRWGDTLLKQVAARVRAVLRPDDVLCRPGGDELVVLLSDRSHDDIDGELDSRDGLEGAGPAAIARGVLAAMKDPFELAGEEVFVSASIGSSVFPLDAHGGEKLFEHAEAAMYQAKQRGKGSHFPYAAELSVVQRSRFSLVTALHHAIERDELLLEYQPVVELASGRMVGVEALLRWRSEREGLVPPGKFIPVAEDTGLIVPIGDWVLAEVVRQQQRWRAQSIELRCAMNVSVRQFRQEDLARRVAEVLEAAGVPPSALELEITESALERDPKRAMQVLGELAQVGVPMAIDDFGTGYSSLSRLKQLPAARLKIDRSFVSGIPTHKEDVAIVRTVIALASNLGKESLAEGIETFEQWRCLREEGCGLGQGYLFCTPVAPAEIERMWREEKRWLFT